MYNMWWGCDRVSLKLSKEEAKAFVTQAMKDSKKMGLRVPKKPKK